MKRLAIALISALLPTLAFSQLDEEAVKKLSATTRISPAEIRRDYAACDGTTLQMLICTGYKWALQDVLLNQKYQALLTDAKRRGFANELLQSQRNWIKYRDSACEFESKFGAEGGSMKSIYWYDCVEALTKERAARLDEVSKW